MTAYPGWLAGVSSLLDEAVKAEFGEWEMVQPRENAPVAWSHREVPGFLDNVFLLRHIPTMSFAARHVAGVKPWWRESFRQMPVPILRARGEPEDVLRVVLSWPVGP